MQDLLRTTDAEIKNDDSKKKASWKLFDEHLKIKNLLAMLDTDLNVYICEWTQWNRGKFDSMGIMYIRTRYDRYM